MKCYHQRPPAAPSHTCLGITEQTKAYHPSSTSSQTATHASVLRNYLCRMSLHPKIKHHFNLLNSRAHAVGNTLGLFISNIP